MRGVVEVGMVVGFHRCPERQDSPFDKLDPFISGEVGGLAGSKTDVVGGLRGRRDM